MAVTTIANTMEAANVAQTINHRERNSFAKSCSFKATPSLLAQAPACPGSASRSALCAVNLFAALGHRYYGSYGVHQGLNGNSGFAGRCRLGKAECQLPRLSRRYDHLHFIAGVASLGP